MELKEIINQKSKLEKEIYNSLKAFTKDTGTVINKASSFKLNKLNISIDGFSIELENPFG